MWGFCSLERGVWRAGTYLALAECGAVVDLVAASALTQGLPATIHTRLLQEEDGGQWHAQTQGTDTLGKLASNTVPSLVLSSRPHSCLITSALELTSSCIYTTRTLSARIHRKPSWGCNA